MITSYLVTGMTCEKCVAHVREEVSELPGVNQVELDLESGRMSVDGDHQVDLFAITAAVAEAGDQYTVTLA